MKSPARRSEEDGFTLIEVLVALAIFSIAAISIVQLSGYAARTAILLQGRALGTIAADNAMVDAVIDLERGQLEEQTEIVRVGDRQFDVRRSIQETPNPLVLQITIMAEELDAEGKPRGARTEITAFRTVR